MKMNNLTASRNYIFAMADAVGVLNVSIVKHFSWLLQHQLALFSVVIVNARHIAKASCQRHSSSSCIPPSMPRLNPFSHNTLACMPATFIVLEKVTSACLHVAHKVWKCLKVPQCVNPLHFFVRGTPTALSLLYLRSQYKKFNNFFNASGVTF